VIRVGAVRWSLLALGLLGLLASQMVVGRSARADTAPIDPGSAIASASVLGAVPIVGNTNLSLTVGDATASYQESEARSSSQTIDLGGIGVILANTPFCGSPVLPSNEQPPPLTDDTVGGTPAATNHMDGAGAEAVTAAPSPESASATTTPVGQAVPGLLNVSGSSTSAVDFVSGNEREAMASSTVQLNIANGLVDLHGLQWSAQQHSGAVAVSSGTFSVGSLSISSVALPVATPAELAGAVSAANKVLSTLGLTLILPRVKTDAGTGAVTVTPLQVTVGRSALSDAVISPLISHMSALESEVNGQTASGNDCSNIKVLEGNLANPTETVANVALGTFSNGGGFDLNFGGVNADTLPPPAFANPFSEGGLAGIADSVLPGTLGASSAIPSSPTAGSFPTSIGAAAPTTTPTTGAGHSTMAAPGSPVSATHCETTSPSGHPGCWSGAAALVGGIAVAAGAVLFLADFRKSRRSRRQAMKEAGT
jgi:hypothetical protein